MGMDHIGSDKKAERCLSFWSTEVHRCYIQ